MDRSVVRRGRLDRGLLPRTLRRATRSVGCGRVVGSTLPRQPGTRPCTAPAVRDGQFCSNDCAGKPRRRRVEIERPGCGETFERRQSLDTEYCSLGCWADEYGVGVSTLYRDGWYRQRRNALQRDGYRCTVCGITNEEHDTRFGFGLDVHHIVPLRAFAKRDLPIADAHSLRNLITVCRTHHPDAPGETVEVDSSG